jgi:hypothetical protein
MATPSFQQVKPRSTTSMSSDYSWKQQLVSVLSQAWMNTPSLPGFREVNPSTPEPRVAQKLVPACRPPQKLQIRFRLCNTWLKCPKVRIPRHPRGHSYRASGRILTVGYKLHPHTQGLCNSIPCPRCPQMHPWTAGRTSLRLLPLKMNCQITRLVKRKRRLPRELRRREGRKSSREGGKRVGVM